MPHTLLTLLVLVPAAGDPPNPPKPYKSDRGAFTVRFPGRPREQSQSTKTDAGKVNVVTATYVRDDGSVWLVSSSEYPADRMRGVKPAEFLAAARDGLKGSDGKILTERTPRKFEAESIPALEVTIDRGKTHVRSRLVLSGNRLYQVQVLGKPEFVGGPAADEFLDSFALPAKK